MNELTYFKREQEVFDGQIGRKLEGDENSGFEHYHAQLRSGEILYMGLRQGKGGADSYVCFADDAATFAYYYERFSCGMYERVDFYALPEEDVFAQKE